MGTSPPSLPGGKLLPLPGSGKLLPLVGSPHTGPIRVRKVCRLVWAGDKAWFMGAAAPVEYGPEARAVCARKAMGFGTTWTGCPPTRSLPDHEAPYPECTCGFYAMKEPQADSAYWQLTSELYGRVIEHRAGWRGERQRVISVRAPMRCWGCAASRELHYVPDGSGVLGAWCHGCIYITPYTYMSGNVYPGGERQPVALEEVRRVLAPVEVEIT
jgi:hypothetical protein